MFEVAWRTLDTSHVDETDTYKDGESGQEVPNGDDGSE